ARDPLGDLAALVGELLARPVAGHRGEQNVEPAGGEQLAGEQQDGDARPQSAEHADDERPHRRISTSRRTSRGSSRPSARAVASLTTTWVRRTALTGMSPARSPAWMRRTASAACTPAAA